MMFISKKSVILILVLCALFGCHSNEDVNEIRKVAERRLAEYCHQENLKRADFGPAKVSPELKYDWSIEYQSGTTPRHVLIIFIRNKQIVEMHRLVE